MDCNQQNRRFLKAKRRKNRSESISNTNVLSNSNTSSSIDKTLDIKNIFERDSRVKGEKFQSNNKSDSKYSVNDRLKLYRKRLAEKQNEVVKVHSIITETVDKASSSRSISSNDNDEIAAKKPRFNKDNKIRESSSKSINKRNKEIKEGFKFTNTTKTSQEICNINDDDVEMEWSPINESTIMSDIQKIRENTFLLNKDENISTFNADVNISLDNRNLYVVIDTNIFLSHLNCVKSIVDIKGDKEVIITVPWIVIQELDYMKDGRSGSKSIQPLASKAINFINEQLVRKPFNFKGQKVQDALCSKYSSSSADDSIMNCCLQIQGKGKTCVLLSNDTNLRNKIIINGLQAFTIFDAMHNISNLIQDKDIPDIAVKAEEIKVSLGNLFSFIIMKEMNKSYGSIWNKMKFMEDPPWSYMDCLERMKHYWSAVFKINLQKQAFKVVEDLIDFINNKKCTNSEHLKVLIDLSLSLCCYFKNSYSQYSKNIEICIKEFENFLR